MPSGYQPEIVQHAFIDFIGSRLHPFWSLTVPKLRLIARRALSDDLIALQFEPNRAFKQHAFGSRDNLLNGWHGGQHIDLSVVIDSINHQRSYSLVGLANQILWWQDDDINDKNKNQQRHTITIAIKPQGLVSDYLTQHAALGTILNSSVPSGNFTLEQASSPIKKLSPLLFIAGGSGITPMLGLITQALQRGHQVTLLYYNRLSLLNMTEGLSQFPLQDHWQYLAAKYLTFNYHLINTEDPSTYVADSRHLSTKSLLALDLPLADTQIFACGSQTLLAGLYGAAEAIVSPSNSLSSYNHSLHDNSLREYSLRENIIIENFGNALAKLTSVDLDSEVRSKKPQTVYLRSRQQQFSSSTTLLMGAEETGIRLNYGCRQGICQLCRCNKVSGVVKNIQTGKISTDGYESIQTCISMPMTDVVLDI